MTATKEGKTDASSTARQLNIVPYARSPAHAFSKTLRKIKGWENGGWDNCGWHDSGWGDSSPHPWQNGRDFMPTVITGKLTDVLSLRQDGNASFVHNKLNDVIFYADQEATKLLRTLEGKSISEVKQEHPDVLDKLWVV
jgi:hypothetical protein